MSHKEAMVTNVHATEISGKEDGRGKEEQDRNVQHLTHLTVFFPFFYFYLFIIFPGFSSNHRAAGAACDVTQPLSAAESGCRPAEEDQTRGEGGGGAGTRPEQAGGERREEVDSISECPHLSRTGQTETPSQTACSSQLLPVRHESIKVTVQIFLSSVLLLKKPKLLLDPVWTESTRCVLRFTT